MNYELSKTWSLQLEPGFSQRGSIFAQSTSSEANAASLRFEFKNKIILNYIELPILMQFHPVFGKLKSIVSVGPEVRFRLDPMKAKIQSSIYHSGQLIEQNEQTINSRGKSALRTFDFGLTAGTGLSYPIGKIDLFAEGRYHFGLINVYGNLDSIGAKGYNRGFSARAGVLIPIGKKL